MDASLILIVAIVGVAGFGVLAFAGFRMMRAEQSGKKGDYKFGEAKPAQPPAAAARLTPPGTHEVLRVLRDDLTGQLMVEIGGQRFTRVMEIQDPNIGRGFMTTLRDLQKFMRGQPTGSAPEMAAPPGAVSPAPGGVPAPRPASGTPPAAPVSEPPPPSRTAATPPAAGTPSFTLPTMNPFKQAQILREMNKQKPPEPKSIPEQIDEVLQDKIAGTALVQRGLKVKTNSTGGVVFYLDGQAFEGVDQVSDAEAQAMIRAAVKDWESKQ